MHHNLSFPSLHCSQLSLHLSSPPGLLFLQFNLFSRSKTLSYSFYFEFHFKTTFKSTENHEQIKKL